MLCVGTGKPSEVCGGYRWGEAYEIHGSCSDFTQGTAFSSILLVCLALYLGVGVAWGRSRVGNRGGLIEAHPHFDNWKEVAGLCEDGMALARSQISSTSTFSGQHLCHETHPFATVCGL